MSLMAGIAWHDAAPPGREAAERHLASALSRHPNEAVKQYRFENALLLKVDVGAYGEPGEDLSVDGDITLITGNPVLPFGPGIASRPVACAELGQDIKRGECKALRAARGVFAGAHYESGSKTLTLFADRLGVRPIYYIVTQYCVIFSTAIRVLEAMDVPGRALDLIGATEVVSLGFPLGTRTAYAHIRTIDAAEIVRIQGATLGRSQYWTWPNIAEAGIGDLKALESALFAAFRDAVRLRLGSDRVTAAFLSGGLDSRCVVAVLANLSACVDTFTFSTAPDEEQYCATRFAQRMRVRNHVVNDATSPPQWAQMIAHAWKAVSHKSAELPEHPQLVWSGDGGSVGLGWVYVSPEMVGDLREGNGAAAITAYLKAYSSTVPSRLLTRNAARIAETCVRRDISQELERLTCADPARSFYFFLLLNDQRRHLASHFEDVDLHRTEYQLPFFDWEFLSLAASVPTDMGLAHRFYNDWLSQFPPEVMAIPWQAYPGHVASPHPMPGGLAYQWDPTVHAKRSRRLRSRFTRQAIALLLSNSFPGKIIRRDRLALATAVHGLGLRNYDYLIRASRLYHRYWRTSGQDYSISTELRAN